MTTSSAAPASPVVTAPPPGAQPPGPPDRWWGFPLLSRLKSDYLGFDREMQQTWGDLVGFRLGKERLLSLYSPDAVREVLVDQADALKRWERGPEVFAQTLGQGVLVTEGEVWQRQRRLLVPAFSPRRLADYGELMVQASRRSLDDLARQAAQPGDVVADWQHVLTQLTMDVILRTLFGVQTKEHADADADSDAESRDAERAVAVLLRAGLREMLQPIPLPNWLPTANQREKRWALQLLDGLIARHLKQREDEARSDPERAAARRDLLAMLRAVRDDGEGGQGGGLDAQELRDQCMTIFQAGHETTATALSWWGGLIARNPQAQQRARAEVQALLGSGSEARDPQPADLARLPWLSATIKEAMRLYPPIAALMTRRNTREITVAGYRVPAGRLIRITPWVLHRDPRWFPQPEAWLPERWLDGSADAAPRGAYLPFGTGPRVCLGQHFALMEMTLIAAMTLQRLSLQADPGEPLPPPDMQVTLRPKGGMVLRFGVVRSGLEPPNPRLGFMAGKLKVPEDFDRMGGDEILGLMGGGASQ